MADTYVQITEGTGTKINASALTVGANAVKSERMVLSDDTDPAGLGKIQAAVPATGDYGLTVRPIPVLAATGTITSVTGAASSTLLLASNTSRVGATVFNDSGAILYLALATSASTTAYTVQLKSGDYYEVPFNFTGAIYGIWSSALGSARVTEVTR